MSRLDPAYKEARSIGAQAEKAEYARETGLRDAQTILDQARKPQRADPHRKGRREGPIAAAEAQYKIDVAKVEKQFEKESSAIKKRIDDYDGPTAAFGHHYKMGWRTSRAGREGIKQLGEVVLTTLFTEGLGWALKALSTTAKIATAAGRAVEGADIAAAAERSRRAFAGGGKPVNSAASEATKKTAPGNTRLVDGGE